jgi:hypothetical protein
MSEWRFRRPSLFPEMFPEFDSYIYMLHENSQKEFIEALSINGHSRCLVNIHEKL